MSDQWNQMECGYVKSSARCRMVQRKAALLSEVWEDMGDVNSDIGLEELLDFKIIITTATIMMMMIIIVVVVVVQRVDSMACM